MLSLGFCLLGIGFRKVELSTRDTEASAAPD